MCFKSSKLQIKKLAFILTLVICITLVGNVTVYADANVPAVSSENVLNVRDFGARGDGTTDDSVAFQRAIDEASTRNMMLLVPPSDNYYLVSRTLNLRSNLHLSGYGATVFMPSGNVRTNLFVSRGNTFIRDVTIEGLMLKTNNNIPKRNNIGLRSNVQGIYIMGIDGLSIRDVTMDNMVVGLKFGWTTTGGINSNINIDNLNIFNAAISLLIHSTENLTMKNSILCGSAGDSTHDHSLYVSGDTNNFLFENVRFINSTGGGIHLYNGYPDKAPPQNMVFKNSIVDNVWAAVYLYSEARNVNISDISISNYVRGFEINHAYNVSISNVDMSQQTQTNVLGDRFAFAMFNLQQSRISDVTIDGKGKTGQLFVFGRGRVDGLEISLVNAFNLNDNPFVFANSRSLVTNLVIENNRIVWDNVLASRIGFRGVGSQAILRNNTFINNGTRLRSLSFNTDGMNILIENNAFAGMNHLTHPLDSAIAINNTRISSTN